MPDDSRARDAFRRRVPSSLAHASADAGLSDRHWCLCFAALAQLRTCVRVRLSYARPVDLGFYPQTPGPHAPHRLLQLERSPSTPTQSQTLTLDATSKLATRQVALPLRTWTNRGFPAPGLHGDEAVGSQPPPRRPLVETDLPGPVRLGHLLSRTNANVRLESRTPATVR